MKGEPGINSAVTACIVLQYITRQYLMGLRQYQLSVDLHGFTGEATEHAYGQILNPAGKQDNASSAARFVTTLQLEE